MRQNGYRSHAAAAIATAVAAIAGVAWLAAPAARGAVDGLTMTGCIGDLSGCTGTTPAGALDGADAVTVSPDGTSVYVAANGAIDWFARNRSGGTLAFEGCIGDPSKAPGCTATNPAAAVDAPDSVAMSPDGTSVYAAAYGSAVIDWFARDTSSGALTFKGCFGDDTVLTGTPGCTATSPVTAVDLPVAVTVSRDGDDVYAAAGNVIDQFSRSASTGALTFKGCVGDGPSGCTPTVPTGALAPVSSVTVSPDDDEVYATAGVASGLVDVLSRNTTTGVLTFVGCSGGSAPCDPSPGASLSFPSAVQVSPDGSSVYAVGSDIGQVAEFTRDGATGALTFNGCIGAGFVSVGPPLLNCTATAPDDALVNAVSDAVAPDGADVYVAGGGGGSIGDVSSLSRAANGTLALTGCIGVDPSDMACTPASPAGALDYANAVAVSPDGNNVYVTAGPGGGGGQIDEFTVSATPGPLPTPTTPTPVPAPTTAPPSAPPAATTTTTFATIRDRSLTLTTPAPNVCTMPAARLKVTLGSTTIGRTSGVSLRFHDAAFYLDRGVRHTRAFRRGKHTVTSVSFDANATVRRLPVTVELSVAGLRPGVHTLTVKVSYRERRRRHDREVEATLVKTLTSQVTVC